MTTPGPQFSALRRVVWRHLSPVDEATDTLALSFAGEDGTVHSFRLKAASAATLRDALSATLADQRRTKTHSESSSGKPASDGSSPFDGQNVAPHARSSSAESAEW